MAGIFDEIEKSVADMPVDQIQEELKKLLEADAKRKVAQKEYNLKPEVQAKRKEYSKAYNEAVKSDPVKLAAKVEARKARNARPEVKERMKEYRNARNQKIKLLVARAKELGITVDGPTA